MPEERAGPVGVSCYVCVGVGEGGGDRGGGQGGLPYQEILKG